MCGSIANIIDNNDNDFEINPTRVKAKYWSAPFKLNKLIFDLCQVRTAKVYGIYGR